jgi:protein associated with RNAse G/E
VKFIKTTLSASAAVSDDGHSSSSGNRDSHPMHHGRHNVTNTNTSATNAVKTRIILRSAPLPSLNELTRTTNVSMAYFNAASKLIAQEESLEFYDYDADIWSIADFQCGCRDEFHHQLIFYDDIHPNRVLSSRYIEKILGLRFTRFYYDYRHQYHAQGTTTYASQYQHHQLPSMFVPRLELCESQHQTSSSASPQLPMHHIKAHHFHTHSHSRPSLSSLLDFLITACPNIEIPIIPHSKEMAQRIHNVHQDQSSQGSIVSNRVKRMIHRVNVNMSTDFYLSVVPHFSMPNSTLTNPRKRLLYHNLDDEIMLSGLLGWGDFYYHAWPASCSPVPTITAVPKYMFLPITTVMIRIRDSSTRNCYLVCEKCQIMYTLPPATSSKNNMSWSSCDLVMNHEKFISEPFLQVKAPEDNVFIHWKYGQGFAMSKQYYDGILIVMPQHHQVYAYMKDMIRMFHSNEKEKVSKYLNDNRVTMKEKNLEDAVWLPHLYFMDCLPWIPVDR